MQNLDKSIKILDYHLKKVKNELFGSERRNKMTEIDKAYLGAIFTIGVIWVVSMTFIWAGLFIELLDRVAK